MMSTKQKAAHERELIRKILSCGKRMNMFEVHAELVKLLDYETTPAKTSDRLSILADGTLPVVAHQLMPGRDSLGRSVPMRVYWLLDPSQVVSRAEQPKHWPTASAPAPDMRDFRKTVRLNPWAYAVALHLSAVNQPMGAT